jgi:hypothetical protein
MSHPFVAIRHEDDEQDAADVTAACQRSFLLIGFVLHAANVALILALIGCAAGALAGLIVFFPFVAGAWGLNLTAILAYENNWR